MNKYLMTARTVADIEIRKTKSGTSVSDFRVACKRKGSSDVTDFIPCVAYGATADNLAKYVGKGSLISIEGELRVENYTAKDGSKRTSMKVLAQNIEFLKLKKPGTETSDTTEPAEPVPAEAEDFNLESGELPF